MSLDYKDMFWNQEEQLKKFVILTDALDPYKCTDYKWVSGEGPTGYGCDCITLYEVSFKYQRDWNPAKYVGIVYNVQKDVFFVTNGVTGAGISERDPEKAAAAAIAYADTFAALR